MPRFNNDDANLPAPLPLPETSKELQAQRRAPPSRSLNDEVDEIVAQIYDEQPEFKQLIGAIWRKDAVEGSLIDDDVHAAIAIKEFAEEHNGRYPMAVDAKSYALRHSLKVALNRLGKGREQRRREALRLARGEFQDAAE